MKIDVYISQCKVTGFYDRFVTHPTAMIRKLLLLTLHWNQYPNDTKKSLKVTLFARTGDALKRSDGEENVEELT